MSHEVFADAEFDAVLEGTETLQRGVGRSGVFMLAADMNGLLGRRLASDDVDIVGAHSIGSDNSRGHVLAHWMHGARLVATGLLFEAVGGGTSGRMICTVQGCERQIEHIFVPDETVHSV